MIAACAKQNLLGNALDLLLTLEKDGFEPGITTYAVLVDWFGKLQLVEEAEATLRKITVKDDAPFEVHVSLCDMYSRAFLESKALEHLKILEAKKELLRADQFDRVISALIAGRLLDDTKRMHERMLAQGFKLPEATSTALSVAQSTPRHKTPITKGRKSRCKVLLCGTICYKLPIRREVPTLELENRSNEIEVLQAKRSQFLLRV